MKRMTRTRRIAMAHRASGREAGHTAMQPRVRARAVGVSGFFRARRAGGLEIGAVRVATAVRSGPTARVWSGAAASEANPFGSGVGWTAGADGWKASDGART